MTAPLRPPLNRKQRDYVDQIARRRSLLIRRLDDYNGASDSRMRHEIAALGWALDVIAETHESEPKPTPRAPTAILR